MPSTGKYRDFYQPAVLDGCSRYLVHWELRESMTEADVEITPQRAAAVKGLTEREHFWIERIRG